VIFSGNVSQPLFRQPHIEEGIKDFKSKLHWEKYTEKIPQKERLEKCIIISSLSYSLQTSLGNQLYTISHCSTYGVKSQKNGTKINPNGTFCTI